MSVFVAFSYQFKEKYFFQLASCGLLNTALTNKTILLNFHPPLFVIFISSAIFYFQQIYIMDRLTLFKDKLKDFSVEFYDVNGTPGIITTPDKVLDICNLLKNDESLSFEMCRDAVGVDRFQKKNRFEVIYNLYSLKFKDRLFVKVLLDTKNPETPSLSGIWTGTNWFEREAYDMVGIMFKDHPDLRRIYMPEEFEYFPLRKDFPLMGIPGSLYLPKK
jgi:NADH-quinone oxidoreductase subunit C